MSNIKYILICLTPFGYFMIPCVISYFWCLLSLSLSLTNTHTVNICASPHEKVKVASPLCLIWMTLTTLDTVCTQYAHNKPLQCHLTLCANLCWCYVLTCGWEGCTPFPPDMSLSHQALRMHGTIPAEVFEVFYGLPSQHIRQHSFFHFQGTSNMP